MYVESEIMCQEPTLATGIPSAVHRSLLLSRLRRRSICHVQSISLAGGDGSEESDYRASTKKRPDSRAGRPRVGVSAYPSPDRTCRHHVFVEHGAWLKKLDLPSTARVVVSQQFEARVGDVLSYNYVALLYADSNFAADRTGVRVILVDLAVATADSLLDRSINGCDTADDGRASSRIRDSKLFTITRSGSYELRFITAVDPQNPGSRGASAREFSVRD